MHVELTATLLLAILESQACDTTKRHQEVFTLDLIATFYIFVSTDQGHVSIAAAFVHSFCVETIQVYTVGCSRRGN